MMVPPDDHIVEIMETVIHQLPSPVQTEEEVVSL